MDTIIAYARSHRSSLVRGVLATVGVVFFRLAMPWPLREVLEMVFPRAAHEGRHLVDYLPASGDPVFWLAGLYVLLALGLGLSEMVQRVNIMRFASQTVHDMRSETLRGAAGVPRHERSLGDIITRIIGDSAMIKAGISGIIVHGLQNGILFMAVCAVLLYISLQLGLIFLAAGLIAIYIGIIASAPVAKTAARQRRKEGDYATALQESLETGNLKLQLVDINASSAKKEVRTTKIITRSSLLIHFVLAAAVGLGLWYGAYGVKSGFIAPGELFLFIAYALTVHRRMVQVGRQVARSGKVMACVDRLSAFIHDEVSAPAADSSARTGAPLESGLRLEQVKLISGQGGNVRPRLGYIDLIVHHHTRVAVLGNIGSGKSSLLRVLAGAEPPDKGKIFWDEKDMSGTNGVLLSMVAYLPQEPVFPPVPLWKVLGLSGPEATLAEHEDTLRQIEAWKVIQRLPAGLDKKVGSSSMSRNEARLLHLAGILLGDQSQVWVLDNPVQGLRRAKARRCLEQIVKSSSKRTVVIALFEPVGLKNFDRVLYMRGGKIRFDGTPAQWDEWRSTKQRVDVKT